MPPHQKKLLGLLLLLLFFKSLWLPVSWYILHLVIFIGSLPLLFLEVPFLEFSIFLLFWLVGPWACGRTILLPTLFALPMLDSLFPDSHAFRFLFYFLVSTEHTLQEFSVKEDVESKSSWPGMPEKCLNSSSTLEWHFGTNFPQGFFFFFFLIFPKDFEGTSQQNSPSTFLFFKEDDTILMLCGCFDAADGAQGHFDSWSF